MNERERERVKWNNPLLDGEIQHSTRKRKELKTLPIDYRRIEMK
jgi:hypothetical protein